MFSWEDCPAAEQVPGKVSGAWVFANNRVPLSHLFANLAAGATVKDWQVRAALKYLETNLLQNLKIEAA